jgi:hypothetical protein
MTLIASALQTFFSDRLTSQRHASPRTIPAYRDRTRRCNWSGVVGERTRRGLCYAAAVGEQANHGD